MSKKINKSYFSEAQDRIYILQDNLENHIINHPAVKSDIELEKLARKAQRKLGELYQKLGQKS